MVYQVLGYRAFKTATLQENLAELCHSLQVHGTSAADFQYGVPCPASGLGFPKDSNIPQLWNIPSILLEIRL